MKNILLVDDDEQVLQAFSTAFEASDYTVICTRSAVEALVVLEGLTIDIAVCDLKMPDMSGIELLKRIKKNRPSTIRILLGSQADEKLVLNSLLDNIAKAHIFKPWGDAELKRIIKQVLDTEELLSSKDLLTVINNTGRLPTLKPFYQEILSAIESDADIAAISARIERDPAISAKMLQMANSAYYGVKTASIQKAATFLGTQNLKNLVLTTSVMDSFTLRGAGSRIAQDVWAQASLTNKIQRILSETILFRRQNHTECTAGLLHNLGIVFMIKQYPDYIPFLSEALADPQADLLALEMNRYGITHAQVGGYLLQWWDLPYVMVEAALYHGAPNDERIINKDLVSIVHVAQHYASKIMGSTGFCRYEPEALRALGVDERLLEEKLVGIK